MPDPWAEAIARANADLLLHTATAHQFLVNGHPVEVLGTFDRAEQEQDGMYVLVPTLVVDTKDVPKLAQGATATIKGTPYRIRRFGEDEEGLTPIALSKA